ncbi:hypothetical protein HaLaN_29890 [Haematococcus lacustris]|uniref:Uncharacterized protein n=1 Tax=Haematococcus lacustris TaxID=44745 RepID=A0A6A0ADI2_HAELA|nr:hypothetical protein HaLaN_29890 [Haematococcus lacustris]
MYVSLRATYTNEHPRTLSKTILRLVATRSWAAPSHPPWLFRMPSASATPSLSAASFDLSPASAKKTWEVELEGRAGLVVRSALRSAFPLPKDKAWLVDFLAESILVEMQGDGQPRVWHGSQYLHGGIVGCGVGVECPAAIPGRRRSGVIR